MCQKSVYIVIPAYNEAARLGTVIRSLQPEYSSIVVVDDGSRDQTYQVAQQQACHVLRHAINRGQGAALQTGISYSLRQGAQFIVTFDADGQHQVSDIAAMLAPVQAGKVDLTLGSRFLGTTSNVPRARRIVLWGGLLFTRLFSGLQLTDCHNGLRALSRHAAERILLRQDRMAHASEFYDQIREARLSYQEVPVSIHYSAETLAKGQSGFNSLSILFQYVFGRISR